MEAKTFLGQHILNFGKETRFGNLYECDDLDGLVEKINSQGAAYGENRELLKADTDKIKESPLCDTGDYIERFSTVDMTKVAATITNLKVVDEEDGTRSIIGDITLAPEYHDVSNIIAKPRMLTVKGVNHNKQVTTKVNHISAIDVTIVKPMVIVVEGLDYAGKTEQVRAIQEYLDKIGINSISTRAPGGTPCAEHLRELAKYGHRDDELSRMAEPYVFAAAIQDANDKIVKPNLEKGNVVICDRREYTTMAYQGFGLNNVDQVHRILRTLSLEKASHVIYYSVTPENRAARKLAANPALRETTDIIEERSSKFIKRSSAGYETILHDLKAQNARLKSKPADQVGIHYIDTNRTIDEVSEETINVLNQIFK